ncbi:Rpn family recombination-promoting nuclease/putative transposase [Sporosarcina sp. CAU 1771]
MVVMGRVKETSIPYPLLSERTQFVAEKKNMNHDQLFKELINHFFIEFMEVFFPEQRADIDFESIQPLSEELYTDLLEGENRRVDIVIQAKLKGTNTLIIVHIEPQSSYQSDFNQRMYNYFGLLYNKYRMPILPIAVFSYDYNRTEKSQFTIEFPSFHVLTFNFLMLELKKKNWRDFLNSDNPVAAALLSKMGYKKKERVQVKIEFLRMMVRMELNPARARFINDFFENYLKLNQKEEEEFMREISQMENAEEFTKLPNSWEERGIRKGIKQGLEQGIQKGIEEAKREVVLEMLKEGSSIEFISKVTHLDKGAIEKLRDNK